MSKAEMGSTGTSESEGSGIDNFPDPERRAVYRAIYERRDIRHFRTDPIPDDALARIIQAAHHGAVGEAAVFFKLQDIAEGDEPAGRAFRLGEHGGSSISWGNWTPGLGKKRALVIKSDEFLWRGHGPYLSGPLARKGFP